VVIGTDFTLFILGVQAFADALLIIIKVLAQNSGLDPQESIVKLQEEYTGPQQAVGLDIKTGIYKYCQTFQ
jgi:T-complex protein 1 subunit zeta